MTPEKIALVRSSWQQVLPIKDTAAQLFYGQLFELDPSLRGMFKGDMVEQGRKLMAMINTVVNSLDKLGPMARGVEDTLFVLQALRGPDPGDPSSRPACRLRRDGSALRHRGQRADLDAGQGAG